VTWESDLDALKMVDEAYVNRPAWIEKTILTTARMGKFSADRAVMQYAEVSLSLFKDDWTLTRESRRSGTSSLSKSPSLDGSASPTTLPLLPPPLDPSSTSALQSSLIRATL
jgi:hypothetical protein